MEVLANEDEAHGQAYQSQRDALQLRDIDAVVLRVHTLAVQIGLGKGLVYGVARLTLGCLQIPMLKVE